MKTSIYEQIKMDREKIQILPGVLRVTRKAKQTSKLKGNFNGRFKMLSEPKSYHSRWKHRLKKGDGKQHEE